MTRREVIAAFLAERDGFHTVNEATQAGFLSAADLLLEQLDQAPMWMVKDVAQWANCAESTISGYQARGQMPEPRLMYGRVRLWEPDVIKAWRPR
jgi:hypothetical protein